MPRAVIGIGVASALSWISAGAAIADDAQIDGWQFSLTPYVWAAGLYGDVTVRGNTASISNSFIDTVKASDSIIGFQGHFEARRGRVGGFVDGTYMRLGEDNIAVGPLLVDATQELAFVEFGLLYRLADLPWESGGGDPAFNSPLGAHVDVYGGGRYTYIGAELEFPIGASVDGSRDWVDPIIGMRIIGDLSEHWQVIIGGDVGGFGGPAKTPVMPIHRIEASRGRHLLCFSQDRRRPSSGDGSRDYQSLIRINASTVAPRRCERMRTWPGRGWARHRLDDAA